MSIYEQMKAAGVETSNHESDLYAKVTPESKKIVKEYEHRGTVSTFTNRQGGGLWYDIPFAFDPYWHKRGMN